MFVEEFFQVFLELGIGPVVGKPRPSATVVLLGVGLKIHCLIQLLEPYLVVFAHLSRITEVLRSNIVFGVECRLHFTLVGQEVCGFDSLIQVEQGLLFIARVLVKRSFHFKRLVDKC